MEFYIAEKTYPLENYLHVDCPEILNFVPKGSEVYVVDKVPLSLDKPAFWETVRQRDITLRCIWTKKF